MGISLSVDRKASRTRLLWVNLGLLALSLMIESKFDIVEQIQYWTYEIHAFERLEHLELDAVFLFLPLCAIVNIALFVTAETRETERHVFSRALRLNDARSGLPSLDALDEYLKAERHSAEEHQTFFAVRVLNLSKLEARFGGRLEAELFQYIERRFSLCCAAETKAFRLRTDAVGFVAKRIGTVQATNEIQALMDEANKRLFLLDGISYPLLLDAALVGLEKGDRSADAAIQRTNAVFEDIDALTNVEGNVHVFDLHVAKRASARAALADGLPSAIDNNQIFPYFQPIYCLTTRRVVGLEALARLQFDANFVMNAGQFMPVAERHGYTRRIDRAVLEGVIARFSQIPPNVSVSLNLSAATLSGTGAIEALIQTLNSARIAMDRVEIELSESLTESLIKVFRSQLEKLHDARLALSVDDFGVQHASLGRLANLPFRKIKLDKALIESILSDHRQRIIVKATIDMAHALGMLVVAEGIETRQQIDVLRAMGCDQVQGYFIGLPSEISEVDYSIRDY